MFIEVTGGDHNDHQSIQWLFFFYWLIYTESVTHNRSTTKQWPTTITTKVCHKKLQVGIVLFLFRECDKIFALQNLIQNSVVLHRLTKKWIYSAGNTSPHQCNKSVICSIYLDSYNLMLYWISLPSCYACIDKT